MKIDQYCQLQRCKHVELEQFLACLNESRGFVSESWAFLFVNQINLHEFKIKSPHENEAEKLLRR